MLKGSFLDRLTRLHLIGSLGFQTCCITMQNLIVKAVFSFKHVQCHLLSWLFSVFPHVEMQKQMFPHRKSFQSKSPKLGHVSLSLSCEGTVVLWARPSTCSFDTVSSPLMRPPSEKTAVWRHQQPTPINPHQICPLGTIIEKAGGVCFPTQCNAFLAQNNYLNVWIQVKLQN